eukprot:TRINITY_DN4999_c0_g1_i1.p1 TRINITY_DN4999_c0_g1~~TRINITY_DN4999_c0_g1_i1.p1  ORF type:complete len:1774 (+),score=459.39 TRINITY_DN4999_c0_g1_i1:165-5486(+)
MAESPNRIPLRRFFTAGELVSDESVGKVRKSIDSAEKYEQSKNWEKALKHFRGAFEILQGKLAEVSGDPDNVSTATNLRQLMNEVQDKIWDMEELLANSKAKASGSTSSVAPYTRPRRDSAVQLPDTTRSRSGTQVGADPSTSSSAQTSTAKSTSSAPAKRTASTAGVKDKDYRVRFMEQKKVYFYTDVTPPTETLSIINGFVTALGLPEEEFEPLYRECVNCVEYPVHAKMPESTAAMLQAVRLAFCLSKEEQDNIMDSSAPFGPKDLLHDLREQLRRVRRNPFYAANTFKDDEDFEKWVESEVDRINRHISGLRKLVSKNPDEKQELSEAEKQEDAYDQEIAAKKKDRKKQKLQNRGRKFSEVREEPNMEGGDAKSQSDDSGESDSSEEEFESEDPERGPSVDRSPLRYDLLFRLLCSRDFSGPKAAELRAARLQPCFSKLDEWLSKTPVRDTVDFDAHYFSLESNAKYEEALFILNKPARWLLDEYAERYGFTPLYRLLVVLSWVVSTLSTDADKLLMLHVMLQRAMNIFKQEEYVYNKKELLFFLRIMKELNREVEHYIFNIFRYFDHTRIFNLRVLTKVVILMFECNEFVGLSDPVRYDDFMRTAIEKSIKNHYRDILHETEEPKDPQAGDPIGTNPTQTVRKRRERSLTADQLIEAFTRVAYHLDHVDRLGSLFPGLGPNRLSDLCADVYLKDLFADVKLFAIKFAQNQSTTRVLVLALQIREVNSTYVQGRGAIEELPVEHLFGSFVEKWLEETETIFKTWVTASCKQESWLPIDPRSKKLWSQSAEELYRMAADPLPFVRQNEVMLVNLDDGEILNPNANDSLVRQYSKMVGRILKEYVEHLYNLFVDEFPEEVHSDLHDLYIQDFFENLNRTGGAGALQITYQQRKKKLTDLFKRKGSGSLSVDLQGSMAAAGRFSTLRGTPKLGKSNAVSEGVRQRTMTIGGGRTNNTLGSTPSTTSLATLNSREAKEYGIRVWNKINFSADKVKKLRKSRKPIDLTARMCIKVNDVETVRVQFEHLARHEKDVAAPLETSFVVMKKVYHIFINMIIYVCNLYMEAEIEYMFAQSKKKPTKEAVGSVYSFCSYLQHQLLVLHANLKINIFRRVLLRIWKVVLEDIIDIIIPSHGQSVPSLAQICVLEDLMDGIKNFFSKYGMSPTHLTQKIQEMHQLARKSANADDLANTRVIYIEQKDKFEKKKSDSKKGIRKQPSKFASVSESSESYLDHSDQPTNDSAANPIIESSMGTNDLSSTTDSDDDSENPPFPKIVPQRREPRRGALSGGVDVEAGGSDHPNGANASGIIEKDDPDSVQLSRQSSGQADTITVDTSKVGASSTTKKRPPAVREIAAAPPLVDTDDVNGGVSETDNILQRRGGKGRYYDETEREDTTTERDTDSDSDEGGNRRRGVRRPVMLKIVAGGADARAARRRAQQEQSKAQETQPSKEAGAVDEAGQPLSEEELARRLEEKLERLAVQQSSSTKTSPPIAVVALTSDDGSPSDSSSAGLDPDRDSSAPDAMSPRSDAELDAALKIMVKNDSLAAQQNASSPQPTSKKSSRQSSPQKDEPIQQKSEPVVVAAAKSEEAAAPTEKKSKKSSGSGKKKSGKKSSTKKTGSKKKKISKSPSGANTDGSTSAKKSTTTTTTKKSSKKKSSASTTAPAAAASPRNATSTTKPKKRAPVVATVDSDSSSTSASAGITRALSSGRVSAKGDSSTSSDSESSSDVPARKFNSSSSSTSSSPALRRSIKDRKPTRGALRPDSSESTESSTD